MILPCGCDNESEDTLCYDARAIRTASQDAYQRYIHSIQVYDKMANAYLDMHRSLQRRLYEHMGAL